MLNVPKYNLIAGWVLLMFTFSLNSCGDNSSTQNKASLLDKIESVIEQEPEDAYQPVHALLVVPEFPAPGQTFRIIATGGKEIKKARILVKGANQSLESTATLMGTELPFWRIDDFTAPEKGEYEAVLLAGDKELCTLKFAVASRKIEFLKGQVWKTQKSWDNQTETLYSAWVNALFQGSGEQTSWAALHEVTQSKVHNFLYNYLGLDEDNATAKNSVKLEPDCADNPFFLRAYFAWKLGLPFGFHICDRGYLGKSPQTGQWITNETPTSKANPVDAFNNYIRMIMNGVHSGTARTALNNQNADYYPVSLDRKGLRPGTIYADPYGHTLIIVSWVPQTKDHPGLLLSVDAQPDKTIAIKRFWKGNFLFNTAEVVGEPGFKAFRPIQSKDGKLGLLKNEELTEAAGYAPFSLQQKKMESEAFYQIMDRVINPIPMDAEDVLADLLSALHGQLLVRVKSVATGEKYMKEHPGTVVPMPGSANGVFQAGGQWEDFSTPNRDLRLLIAIDAVLNFPEKVAASPEYYKLSKSESPEKIKEKLQAIIDKKTRELTISYTRSNGSEQVLTLVEVIKRREALEMAYNPNDGPEIRWGAPEKSEERSTCKRFAPANQQKTMQSVRKWFNKRLHPPT